MFRKIILALLILGSVFFFYNKYNVAPTIKFHELSLTDLDGKKVNLQDYAGTNIFITMWAPWCRDCLSEMPDLQFISKQLKKDNFIFLAISGYDIEKERNFALSRDYDFDFLHMNESLKFMGVHSIPTNYILNTEGKVVYEKVGAELNWRSKETLDMLRALVK